MFVDFPFSFTRDGWQILGPVWEMTKVNKIYFFFYCDYVFDGLKNYITITKKIT